MPTTSDQRIRDLDARLAELAGDLPTFPPVAERTMRTLEHFPTMRPWAAACACTFTLAALIVAETPRVYGPGLACANPPDPDQPDGPAPTYGQAARVARRRYAATKGA